VKDGSASRSCAHGCVALTRSCDFPDHRRRDRLVGTLVGFLWAGVCFNGRVDPQFCRGLPSTELFSPELYFVTPAGEGRSGGTTAVVVMALTLSLLATLYRRTAPHGSSGSRRSAMSRRDHTAPAPQPLVTPVPTTADPTIPPVLSCRGITRSYRQWRHSKCLLLRAEACVCRANGSRWLGRSGAGTAFAYRRAVSLGNDTGATRRGLLSTRRRPPRTVETPRRTRGCAARHTSLSCISPPSAAGFLCDGGDVMLPQMIASRAQGRRNGRTEFLSYLGRGENA